ncbi:pyrroline-5-carboxylate reductase [Methylopila jiangsuensis]|uniref:Pyrroline-5-carboxylate reductase n=1 Tax=Methylopila jiangsuensis TaxID=586230 RepID=A0A9W6JEE0_9HYPH|nr:pyrroline-5-carboxylate reductase [Methylopila jiangsuensis]MDR6285713.1 pyrroline-5-carboxylate reductase [Methylopila jiangsuensis]GLK75472.1 pyrroline-5-carboxylate reductase [Methylopila jiangsuensis]
MTASSVGPLQPGGPIVLIGAGKMGGALLDGWLAGGLDPALAAVVDPGLPPEAAAALKSRGVALVPDPAAIAAPAAVVLAVKPQMVADALPVAAAFMQPGAVLVSVLAGVTSAKLAAGLPAGAAVVRAMPNTPAAIGRGITGAFATAGVSAAQTALADALLKAGGQVEWLDDEGLIDAVTGVSGSGPAYVFLLAEALAEAGVKAGLPAELAARLARATVEGAGELLRRSPETPETLRRNVTSPNGTTAAALSVLMADDGLGALMARAVAAAAHRSRELAG